MKLRIKADDIIMPSTSKKNSASNKRTVPQSPESPLGRIAKNNAKLLNGFDLNGGKRSGYAEEVNYAIPDLQTSELEKCSTISKFLEGKSDFSIHDNWHNLQHELEKLATINLDQQKTMHGEIAYLTSGDYPLVKLNDRPMPKFQLREHSPTERRSSINKVKFKESFAADLGLLSSPEDDEDPSILDIPQRFWRWTREYLRHISDDYVRDFKTKLVDRFDDANILGKYCGDARSSNKQNLMDQSPAKGRLDLSEIGTPGSSKSPHKRFNSRNSDSNPTPTKMPRTDFSPALSNSNTNTSHLNVSDWSQSSHSNSNSPAKAKGLPTGMEDEMSDEEESEDEAKSDDEISPQTNGTGHRHGTAAHNGGSSKKNGPKSATKKSPKKSPSSAKRKIDLGRRAHQKPGKTPKGLGAIKEEQIAEDDTDEVSCELRKKQDKLRAIYETTRPLIEELYRRVSCEYAVYEMARRLDAADDKLFELGLKYERLHLFNKDQRAECKSVMAAREQAAQPFIGI